MTIENIPQPATRQELYEITEYMCSSGVFLKPVREALLDRAAKDLGIARLIKNTVDHYIHTWNRMRWGEFRRWHQMTARALFAGQTELRLIKFKEQVEAAEALANAA